MIDKDELLFVVDENNLPLTPKPRKEVHSKGIWHRSSNVWVVNSKKQVLCQKRSRFKDVFPGLWETNFGGNLEAKEEYLACAVRETNEELNLNIQKEDLKFFKVFQSEVSREFIAIYFLKLKDKQKISFQKNEIERIKWFNISELKEIYLRKDQKWINLGYNLEALKWLEKNSLK